MRCHALSAEPKSKCRAAMRVPRMRPIERPHPRQNLFVPPRRLFRRNRARRAGRRVCRPRHGLLGSRVGGGRTLRPGGSGRRFARRLRGARPPARSRLGRGRGQTTRRASQAAAVPDYRRSAPVLWANAHHSLLGHFVDHDRIVTGRRVLRGHTRKRRSKHGNGRRGTLDWQHLFDWCGHTLSRFSP